MLPIRPLGKKRPFETPAAGAAPYTMCMTWSVERAYAMELLFAATIALGLTVAEVAVTGTVDEASAVTSGVSLPPPSAARSAEIRLA